ncbi:hypothetical protein HQ531_04235 [bacterium]|nr:hypothetical protein [bacterium]
MNQFDLINVSLAGYLLISGLLINWIGIRISASRQHQFAFVTIIVLISGIIPQIRLSQVAPGIVFSLGMMLFALQLSAYYSGTAKNSARIYAVILFLSALVLAQLAHPVLQTLSFGRFIMMGGIWLLLLKLERIISSKAYVYSRVEAIFLWVWFISSGLSLVETQIQILPDLFFLLLLLTHLEKRWPHLSVPAPIIALYGILFVWHAHFLAISNHSSAALVKDPVPVQQMLITALLVIGFLLQSYRSQSLTKKYLYLFIAQEIMVLGLQIENMFANGQELIGLLRLLLFISLIGLFVMIETIEGKGLNSELLKGLRFERPRFTLGIMVIALFLMLYPLGYVLSNSIQAQVLFTILAVAGSYWAFDLYRICVEKTDRKYRILRPSVSIWSTVVFTILWAAVTFIEILTRDYLG